MCSGLNVNASTLSVCPLSQAGFLPIHSLPISSYTWKVLKASHTAILQPRPAWGHLFLEIPAEQQSFSLTCCNGTRLGKGMDRDTSLHSQVQAISAEWTVKWTQALRGQWRSAALHINTYWLFFSKTTQNNPSTESQTELEECAWSTGIFIKLGLEPAHLKYESHKITGCFWRPYFMFLQTGQHQSWPVSPRKVQVDSWPEGMEPITLCWGKTNKKGNAVLLRKK